jgi:NAD-dependent SIR2 family protein deacetylase
MTEPAGIPDWAYGVRSLVVFSGAGISTDSGIPDFRGPNGAWTKDPGAQHRNTYQAFMADPDLRAAYWKSRFENEVWTAEPNVSHQAVAGLMGSDIDTTVITQNTDGLHQRGGMPADRVIELHGTIRVTECVGCGQRSQTTEVLARIEAGEAVPPCASCGGILKTATTMFGQTMSPDVFSRATRAVTTCDLVLAVGTSLVVEPAGSLCATAVQAGATLVIVNLGETPYDSIATAVIREPLGEALPRIVAQLRAGSSDVRPDSREDAPVEHAPDVRPSLLLRPRNRTARFMARTNELDRLTMWCTGPGTRAHLVWGPPGIGKTRLALELASRVQDEWEVRFLVPTAPLPESSRPLLVVVDDAETCADWVRQLLYAASERPSTRILLLARTRDGWWPELRQNTSTEEQLRSPSLARSGRADAVREATTDYAAALNAMGVSSSVPDRAFRIACADVTPVPGEQQASVLAGLLGLAGPAAAELVRQELVYLRRSAHEHGLALPADVVEAAVATAVLCGARDESAALTVLGHIPALCDEDLRLRAARWLRKMYPPDASTYWTESLPSLLTEELAAACVTSKLLVGMFTEATRDQERRALTVLARAATTRPALRERLSELLSVLPGVSPAAVDAALHAGYPAPLAEALTSLARTAALPADLLEAVPMGTTVLGEFPVLLAASLVEAYEHRVRSYPETALPWLVTMQAEFAERLLDLGRTAEGLSNAQLAVDNAGRLADRPNLRARAATALRRARSMAGE